MRLAISRQTVSFHPHHLILHAICSLFMCFALSNNLILFILFPDFNVQKLAGNECAVNHDITTDYKGITYILAIMISTKFSVTSQRKTYIYFRFLFCIATLRFI